MTHERSAAAIEKILSVMMALRSPSGGCPWDLEQTFETIAPYTIEEAYEVADAIARGDLQGLRTELGDLLFQVVFHSRIAEELCAFDFADVVEALVSKMVSRHPHVFGQREVASAEAQAVAWEEQKALERQARGAKSVLDDVPLALPALLRALKLTRRAARIGFDWPDPDQVVKKLEEELSELEEARRNGDQAAVLEEVGDVLFTVANLARKLGVDPEEALRASNAKFEVRFRYVEQHAAPGDDLAALEALWVQAKRSQARPG